MSRFDFVLPGKNRRATLVFPADICADDIPMLDHVIESLRLYTRRRSESEASRARIMQATYNRCRGPLTPPPEEGAQT